MFRSDARVIESGRYRMRLAYLAEGILQNQRVAALQYPGRPKGERGRIVAEPGAAPARLDAFELDLGIVDERME
jgi:hypothetical protein